jgi:hypothetical protein
MLLASKAQCLQVPSRSVIVRAVLFAGLMKGKRWIRMLTSFGRRLPHEMVTREGGLGFVKSLP